MTIDGLNEVRLHAFELALDIIRDENSGIKIVNVEDKKDIFTLADKIYKYITNVA